ncbi:unnamed protein product [Bemisia tabaci]|uniref:Prefoldin subunit 3 n=1 Tax=Bemisia tabaci TaxID=7038 RepID=A0A9P0A6I3_BEMTA|nr:PREDICTED: prefoldin subunit 3 [Bemisia tabaci]CAH0384179.1 unnamed protein product [Bemisia tabaci]
MGDQKSDSELDTASIRTKIPQAKFVDDVDKFLELPENNGSVETALNLLGDQRTQYLSLECNLLGKRNRLKFQIPDLEKSLKIIQMLQKQQSSESDIDTHFLLSEQVYMRASVPPSKKVCLWLGANVMLEYTLEDAIATLLKNIESAKTNLHHIDESLVFLRDQFTTTEVNMARVFNWDVKRRQAAKASNKQS